MRVKEKMKNEKKEKKNEMPKQIFVLKEVE
jgi:hypothetical protein